eukprot:1917311-Rhodomonas_salina.1
MAICLLLRRGPSDWLFVAACTHTEPTSEEARLRPDRKLNSMFVTALTVVQRFFVQMRCFRFEKT